MSQGLTIVVMGVSGCGKSTVAEKLAARLSVPFKDADDLHPKANIDRMSAGLPLRDSDRLPWLQTVSHFARTQVADGLTCVIACSALKKQYREIINQAGRVLYVYLDGSPALIQSRMSARVGHFMPSDLLASQFAALEVPNTATENVLAVDIDKDIESIVESALLQLRAHLG